MRFRRTLPATPFMNASKSLQLALAALLLLAGACGGDDDGPTGLATGSIEISVVTTGSALDSDGYTVSVDGMSSQSIAINGSVTFAGVAAGEHEVELSSVVPNCVVAGENPHTVTVLAGGTLSTGFNVSCALAPLSGRIAFATDRDGNLEI